MMNHLLMMDSNFLALYGQIQRSRARRRKLLLSVAIEVLRMSREPTVPSYRLNLRIIHEDDFVEYFRFTKDDFFSVLLPQLQLPETVITPARVTAPKAEALAILLRRLAYPDRLADLELLFHRSRSELSSVFETNSNTCSVMIQGA